MKRILTVALAVLAAAPSFAQRKATIENVPDIPYTSAPNLLKLPPGEYLGESVAVATNSKGHIFVYHRSANTRLFEFDAAGTFVKEIGAGFYGFDKALNGDAVDVGFELGPAVEAVAAGEDELGVVQGEGVGLCVVVLLVDFAHGCGIACFKRGEKFFGLALELFEVGMLAHPAGG